MNLETVIFDPMTDHVTIPAWKSIVRGEEPWAVTPVSREQGQAWWLEDVQNGTEHAVLVHQDSHGLVTGWEFWGGVQGVQSIESGFRLWFAVSNLIRQSFDNEQRS